MVMKRNEKKIGGIKFWNVLGFVLCVMVFVIIKMFVLMDVLIFRRMRFVSFNLWLRVVIGLVFFVSCLVSGLFLNREGVCLMCSVEVVNCDYYDFMVCGCCDVVMVGGI